MKTELPILSQKNLCEQSGKILSGSSSTKELNNNIIPRQVIQSLSDIYTQNVSPDLNTLRDEEIPSPNGMGYAINKILQKFDPLQGQASEYIEYVKKYANAVKNTLLKLGARIPIEKALKKEYIKTTKEKILDTLSKMEDLDKFDIGDSRLDSSIEGKVRNENGQLEEFKIKILSKGNEIKDDLSIEEEDLDAQFFEKIVNIVKPHINETLFKQTYTKIENAHRDSYDKEHIECLELSNGSESSESLYLNDKKNRNNPRISFQDSTNKALRLVLDHGGSVFTEEANRRKPLVSLFNELKERILNIHTTLSKTPEAREEEIRDSKRKIVSDYEDFIPRNYRRSINQNTHPAIL